jgi:hypothetical protein
LENAQKLELYPRPDASGEVEILFVFFQKQKDWNGKREYGWENARAFWF